MWNKLFNKTLIVFCSSMTLANLLIIGSNYVYAQNSEPLCYLETKSGQQINLEVLCGVRNNKNFVINNLGSNSQSNQDSLNSGTKNLNIESVTLKHFIYHVGGKTEDEYYLTGIIKNNSNNSQTDVKVNYTIYKLRGGNLEKNQAGMAEVSFLDSGQKTTFKEQLKIDRPSDVILKKYPNIILIQSLDAIMIDSIYSEESGLIPINTCYAKSIDKQLLCKNELNASSTQELTITRISQL